MSALSRHFAIFLWGISGRRYKIGPVCLSVCLPVFASVRSLTAEPCDKWTPNFYIEVDLDKIMNEFDGQGQRSKSPGKKRDFWSFKWADLRRFTLSCHMMSCDSMMWCCDAIWCHIVTSFAIFGKDFWQSRHDMGGPSTLRRFHTSMFLHLKWPATMSPLEYLLRILINSLPCNYSLGQTFRTFKWDFFLAFLEEIGNLWKG